MTWMPLATMALDSWLAFVVNVTASPSQSAFPVCMSNATGRGLPSFTRLAWTRPSTTVTANVPLVSMDVPLNVDSDVHCGSPGFTAYATMCPRVLMNTQPPATIGGGDWYPVSNGSWPDPPM